MRKSFKNAFSRGKKAEAEAASTTEGTAASGPDATPLAQHPALYSTEGHIGMKVVAEPENADLEYVLNPSYFIVELTDGVP